MRPHERPNVTDTPKTKSDTPRNYGPRKPGSPGSRFHARRGGSRKAGPGGAPQASRRNVIAELAEPVDASAFAALGLAPNLVATLGRLGYANPTPIQMQAIPAALSGRDVMGLAQTGTGKTAAFGQPLIQAISAVPEAPLAKTARALILAPTRELANQIADNLHAYVRGGHLRVTTVVGGASIRSQCEKLMRGTDILVATPGRLLDLIDRKAVRLDATRFLVLDEADQMLDLGFIVPLKKIAAMLNRDRQTMLFSATMPKSIEDLTKTYLSDPLRVQVATPGKTADRVAQSVHFVQQGGTYDLLKSCLNANPTGLALVFGRTKHGMEKIKKRLADDGFKVDSIHGNKSQAQRERAIAAFRSGQIRILVATDVAARGIDIPGVTHVYNFELPEVPENYVHRIGRTARAGAEGIAVAFCAPDELVRLRDIERLTGIVPETASGERPERASRPASKPQGRKPQGGKPGFGKPSGGKAGEFARRPDFKGQRRKPRPQAA